MSKQFIFSYPEKPRISREATPFEYARANGLKRRPKPKKSDKTIKILEKLVQRDGYICKICDKPIDLSIRKGPNTATIDHIIPRSLKGTNNINNLRIAHAICNHTRGNKL